MERVFEAINGVFSFIGPLSDFLWDFPTNFDWYSSIPILGNISFAIILLLGSGIFFSFRIGFMQVTYFKKGIRTMTEKRVVETGISPLASFFLSSAMRVGPGNILGVRRRSSFLWKKTSRKQSLDRSFSFRIVYSVRPLLSACTGI